MALSRRTGQRFQGSIWPGFVDAMTGLLLVLMFVLTMFMVMQFVLRETITGQESELDDLGQEIAALASALGLERDRTTKLENDLGALNATLDDATTRAQAQSALIAALQQERSEQSAALEQASAQITNFETQVASLLSQRDDALSNVAALEDAQTKLLSEKEALDLALAAARTEIDDRVEAARLAAAQREAMDALIADLRADGAQKDAALSARAVELSDLQQALSEEEKARLLEAEAAKALRARLENADAELTAMTLNLEAQRKEAENTLTLLAAARSAQSDLTAQLAAAVTSGQDTDLAKIAVEKELSEILAQLALARSDLETARDEQAQTALSQQTDAERSAARIAAMIAAQKATDQNLTDVTNARDQALEELRQIAVAQAVSAAELSETALARDTANNSLATLKAAQDAAGKKLAELDREQEKSAELVAALTSELARTRDALAKTQADLSISQDQSEIELTLAAALAARTSAELEREEVQRQLASALAAKLAAEQQAEIRLDDATEQAILLAAAREELVDEQARASEAQRQTEALNQQVAALRGQLSSLQAILDEAKSQDLEAKVQLQNLGSDLNAALARVAAEERKRRQLEEAERIRLEAEAKELQEQTKDLERYRSEFFGRLRDVLGSQDGVRIEGDRFVFSSEVLFPPGQANLSNEGRGEVSKVANILRSIANDIPNGIDWVIRVDGHTDNVPLSGLGTFADNWELSQARALSVVKYMVNFLGIPPSRLAANGFGQYQPVNTEDTDEARAQNRRIELKFTEK
jgi:chemotaxis protein MotB